MSLGSHPFLDEMKARMAGAAGFVVGVGSGVVSDLVKKVSLDAALFLSRSRSCA